MSDAFVGEIRMFGGNFAPAGWALCDGQLLSVASNDALFSLLGTIYGGDGRTTFGLPDLRGRVPIHMGSGPGLSPRTIGLKAGVENATVSVNQYPAHDHGGVAASSQPGASSSPAGGVPATTPTTATYASGADEPMNAAAIAPYAPGANSAHPNVQPFVCVNFIICLFGIYPSRS